MTDAEIVRFIAENARMDLDGMCKRAWMVPADDLPEGDIDEAMQNAANAIEENARLRDMLDDTVGALESLCGERPAWQYLLDEVRAALRKPDAAGGDDE